MAHALHILHMHVKEGFRPWIIFLNSNCSNNVLGETRGGARAPEPS